MKQANKNSCKKSTIESIIFIKMDNNIAKFIKIKIIYK